MKIREICCLLYICTFNFYAILEIDYRIFFLDLFKYIIWIFVDVTYGLNRDIQWAYVNIFHFDKNGDSKFKLIMKTIWKLHYFVRPFIDQVNISNILYTKSHYG